MHLSRNSNEIQTLIHIPMKFLTAISLLLNSFLLAAHGYYPGVVVRVSGDTVKGFIEVRETDFNPTEVKFKATRESEHQLLSNSEINYFDVAEYRVYAVSIWSKCSHYLVQSYSLF
jgi:hypothetical protein